MRGTLHTPTSADVGFTRSRLGSIQARASLPQIGQGRCVDAAWLCSGLALLKEVRLDGGEYFLEKSRVRRIQIKSTQQGQRHHANFTDFR